jgi:hypothetical protein
MQICTTDVVEGAIKNCRWDQDAEKCVGDLVNDVEKPPDPWDDSNECWDGDVSCVACLGLGCGWMGSCLPSCNMIADAPCYEQQTDQDTAE